MIDLFTREPWTHNAKEIPMEASLMEQDDGIQFTQNLLDSRSHWMLVCASSQAVDLLETIETAHYQEGGLTTMVLPVNGLPVALVMLDKKNMAGHQLADLLGVDEEMHIRDVLLTPDLPVAVIEWLLQTFTSASLN